MTLLQRRILDVLRDDELSAQDIEDRIHHETVGTQFVTRGEVVAAISTLIRAEALTTRWQYAEPGTREYGRRVYRKATP